MFFESKFINFEALLQRFVKFTHDTLEFARRETLAYCDQFIETNADVAPSSTPEDLTAKVSKYFEDTAALEAKVTALKASVSMANRQAKEAGQSAKKSTTLTVAQRAEAEGLMKRISDSLSGSEETLSEISEVLHRVPQIKSAHDLLSSQMHRFSERLAEAYETMSLGLTAESLVHEISVIAEGLAERVAEVKKFFDNSARFEAKTKAFVRHVDTSITALRKQLGHLDPSLKYAREKREAIDMLEFAEGLKTYHESRWRDGDIVMDVRNESDKSFIVDVNTGKLTQIFDNLIQK